jgi:hypothetical protein
LVLDARRNGAMAGMIVGRRNANPFSGGERSGEDCPHLRS